MLLGGSVDGRHGDEQGLQQFITDSPWDDTVVRRRLHICSRSSCSSRVTRLMLVADAMRLMKRKDASTIPIRGYLRWLGHDVRVVSGGDDKAGVLDAFATGLELPGWFGHNWDALVDALRDLDAPRGVPIELDGAVLGASAGAPHWPSWGCDHQGAGGGVRSSLTGSSGAGGAGRPGRVLPTGCEVAVSRRSVEGVGPGGQPAQPARQPGQQAGARSPVVRERLDHVAHRVDAGAVAFDPRQVPLRRPAVIAAHCHQLSLRTRP
mgnify:CR=1 FL=1